MTKPALSLGLTPVIDLLWSPTGSEASDSSRPPGSSTDTSHSPSQLQSHDSDFATDLTSDSDGSCSSRGLGDFKSLFNLLNQDTGLFWKEEREAEDTIIPISDKGQSFRSHLPVTILKRPSLDEPTISHHPGQSSEPIPIPNATESKSVQAVASTPRHISPKNPAFTIFRRTAAKQPGPDGLCPPTSRDPPKASHVAQNVPETPGVKSLKALKKMKPEKNAEPITSESSAEADSDSSAVIFDTPLPSKVAHLAFVPGQVGTPDNRYGSHETPPSSYDDMSSTLQSRNAKNIVWTSAGIRVLPAAYKTATERRIGLVTKLMKDFPQDAHLVSQASPLKPAQHEISTRPIHIFVDLSNIMVGFHDSVKVSRDIPVSTRIRRLHMSFSNFSLIMERGRPATKRVLVGSDRLPSIDEAQTLGYEANILDRVHKVKHVNPRPFKHRKNTGYASQKGNRGPETASDSKERWVEQGVDEILHLKMLESLLDTDEPATMVLASGDAAAAEYSGGFMRMVERALQHGWTVEVVSFSQVTSYSYRNKEFRAKWGKRFRLIELDRYVEELFD